MRPPTQVKENWGGDSFETLLNSYLEWSDVSLAQDVLQFFLRALFKGKLSTTPSTDLWAEAH